MEYKRLGDIATYINGYAFKPEQWSNNGKPIIRIQNLNNKDAEYNYFDGEIDEKYLINKGDVLISWSASIGVYEWDLEEAYLNQHIFKVVFDKEEIDKRYFKFMVDIALNKAVQYMHGSTMKHITKKYFDNILVPVPSLCKQNKIADVLDKAKFLINKKKEQIDLLDELIKSRFVEIFGNPRDKKFESKKLPQIIKDDKNSLKRGPFGGSLKKDDFINEGYLVYEQRHAIHNDFEYEKYYISQEKYDSMIAFKVEPKDLIVSCSGTVGRISEIPVNAKKGIINQALLKITLNQDIMNNIYFMNLFRNEQIQDKLFGFSRGSGIANFPSMKEVKEIEFLCPPIELQNEFAEFVTQTDLIRSKMETSLSELEDNFNSLMQKAFKGELF